MKPRITSAAAASALALSLIAPASFAGTTAAETHAYFEAQRQLTDGHVAPTALRDDRQVRTRTAAAPSASERQFLFQVSRTDGSAEPVEVTEGLSEFALTWGAGRPRAMR